MSQTSVDEQNWLRRKAQEWAREVVRVHNTPVPSDMQPEKDALLERAKFIKNSIEGVLGTIPELDPMNQLGALPVIIGGVGAAAAAAYIAQWYYRSKIFFAQLHDRNALYDAFIEQGMDPAQAAKEANIISSGSNTRQKSTTDNLLSVVKYGVGAWVLYLGAKHLRII